MKHTDEHLICTHDPHHPDQLSCHRDSNANTHQLFGDHWISRHFKIRFDRHYHLRHKNARFHIAADIILVSIVIIGLFSIAILLLKNILVPNVLVLTAPKEMSVTNAAITPISVTISAHSQSLHDIQLIVIPPHSFEIKSIDHLPIIRTAPQITINDLRPNDTKSIEINGIAHEKINTKSSISFFIHALDSKNQPVTAQESITYTIVRSAITIALDSPPSAAIGERISVTSIITNDTASDIDNLVVATSSSQNSDHSIKHLKSHESVRIPLILQAKKVGSQPIDVTVSQQSNGDTFELTKIVKSVSITPPSVSVNIHIDPSPLTPSESRSLSLSINNAGAKNGIVGIRLDGQFLSPHSLTSNNGSNRNDREIVWDIQHMIQNKSTPTAIIHTILPSTISSLDSDAKIILQPFVRYTDTDGRAITIEQESLAIDYTSPLELSAASWYFSPEGEQLGRGPLPPRVGKTTKYQIFISPHNIFHPFTLVSGYALLGEHASWTAQISRGGEYCTYDDIARTIRLNFGTIPLADSNASSLGCIFELSLLPTSADLSTEPILLHDISISGIDSITRQKIKSTIAPLTTRLESDTFAKGKSRVIP